MATVKTIVTSLNRQYSASDEIVIAWWDKSWFEEMMDVKLDDDDWDTVLASAESVMEFLGLGDHLMMEAERALQEAGRMDKNGKLKKRKKEK